MVSVVIPLRGEACPPAVFFDRLLESGDVEILAAADPSTPAETLRFFSEKGAVIRIQEGPRGERLRAAATNARNPILLFLHADTLLPSGWASLVTRAIGDGFLGGAFRLEFATHDPRMKWVAWWANVRTRLTRVPYGDQAPFVRKDIYEKLGGHEPWPLLEDVDFSQRLKRAGQVALLEAAVETSPRRYAARGISRTVLSNWGVLLRYHAGVSPETLARSYRRSP